MKRRNFIKSIPAILGAGYFANSLIGEEQTAISSALSHNTQPAGCGNVFYIIEGDVSFDWENEEITAIHGIEGVVTLTVSGDKESRQEHLAHLDEVCRKEQAFILATPHGLHDMQPAKPTENPNQITLKIEPENEDCFFTLLSG